MAISLDLEKHLTFYGAYHHNATNVAIHMVCVPLILFTSLCLATNTGPLIPLPSYLTIPNLEPNFGTIGAVVYGALYILLEPVAGTILAAFCIGATALGSHLREQDPTGTNQWALALFVVCWIFQFIGHGAFEGRAPALLDNLVQALFLAPLFVWLEFLFKFGYRPELQARVEKKVQVELEKFKAEKEKKKA